MNKLIETGKEIDRILTSGIEIHPNSPIHEKLKQVLNITDVSVFVCSKNTNYSECEEMQIGGNCKECEFLINKR